MLDTLIQGGLVVSPLGTNVVDVAIHEGRIVGLGAPQAFTNDVQQVIDAGGMLVIPGGIDPHVHSNWPVPTNDGNVSRSAGPGQISRAALFGGTTSLPDFAVVDCTIEDELAAPIAAKRGEWTEADTDFSLHVLLQGEVTPAHIDQIAGIIGDGHPSIKLFTTRGHAGHSLPPRPGRMLDYGTMWEVMQAVAQAGGVLAMHAEDDDIVSHNVRRFRSDGTMGIERMADVHSSMSEAMSFRRLFTMARYVEGSVMYMMHVSARDGVDAIAEAQAEGLAVFGETLPQYATFTADEYARPDGVVYHTYPSLKYDADRERLWSGLRDGALSTLATDEVCTTKDVKVQGKTIIDATGGNVGVETRLAVAYTEAVSKRGLSLERFVELTSTNAARILGLYPRKGVLTPGSDADIVIFEHDIERVLRNDELHGSDYSPWEKWEVHGWPKHVILGGELMVSDGQFIGRTAQGRFIPRSLTDDTRTMSGL